MQPNIWPDNGKYQVNARFYDLLRLSLIPCHANVMLFALNQNTYQVFL